MWVSLRYLEQLEPFQTRLADTTEVNTPNGMLTSVFGPSFWKCLHLVSFNYPHAPTRCDKERHRSWFLLIGHILPCTHCRENFTQNLKDTGFSDAIFESRDSFSRYCWQLHNHINKMLTKPDGPPYDDVKAEYDSYRSQCSVDPFRAEQGCVLPLYM